MQTVSTFRIIDLRAISSVRWGWRMDCETNIASPVGPEPLGWGSGVIAAVLFAVAFCSPAVANTSVFSNAGTGCTATSWCRSLSDFGVLTGINDSIVMNGNWAIGAEAGVGLQAGSTLKVLGTGTNANTFANIIDFADPVHATTGTTCAATGGAPNPNLCGSGTINGATTTASTRPILNNALVTEAGTQLTNIESYLAGVTGTSTAFVTSGTITNIEGGTNYNSSTHVALYKNTAAYTQGGAITIGCTGANCAKDLVIIQMTSTTSATFNANINLTGGLTSDQVLFYFSSAGFTAASTTAAFTLHADFFLTSSKTATFGQTSGTDKAIDLEGRIYGSSIIFNTKSGVGGIVDDLGQISPEPGTWAMMASGLAAAIWLHHRRKRAARQDA